MIPECWPKAYLKCFLINNLCSWEYSPKGYEKKILLTIDDAFQSFYEVAWPYLKENKIPFILFVSTEPVGKRGYMTWEQIKEIERDRKSVV